MSRLSTARGNGKMAVLKAIREKKMADLKTITELKTMFLVMGVSGSWEDRASWVVACVGTRGVAEVLRGKAQECARKVIAERLAEGDCDNFAEATAYDLNMRVVDGQVQYYTQPVLFVEGMLGEEGLLRGADQIRAAGGVATSSDRGSIAGAGHQVMGAFGDKLRQALNGRKEGVHGGQ